MESTHVEKAGESLTCKHCGHGEFLVHDVKLKSAWMQFIEDDWLSEFAEVNICGRCGYVHWFTPIPTKELQHRQPCPQCNQLILNTRSFCPYCDYDLDPGLNREEPMGTPEDEPPMME
jgi:ribosomal protein S27AE